MFGAWAITLIATAANLLLLRTRLEVENEALTEHYGEPDTPSEASEAGTPRRPRRR